MMVLRNMVYYTIVYYAIPVFICWNMFCVKLQYVCYNLYLLLLSCYCNLRWYVRKKYGKYIRGTSNNHHIMTNTISLGCEGVLKWI